LRSSSPSEIGPDLFRAACNWELEGLVSKRADRPYRLVAILCHPFGVGKMALESLPRSIRFAVRVDCSTIAPVGTFHIRIEHTR
jgi:hypothetical protein